MIIHDFPFMSISYDGILVRTHQGRSSWFVLYRSLVNRHIGTQEDPSDFLSICLIAFNNLFIILPTWRTTAPLSLERHFLQAFDF